jgi:hypothetical protein
VDQLWDEVEGVIALVNSWMIPLLKLFGAEEGNGISPFAVAIKSPSELLALVNRFFRPPKRDKRGTSSLVEENEDEDEVNMDLEGDGDEEDVGGGEKDDEDTVELVDDINANARKAGVVSHHVREIQQATADDDNADDLTTGEDGEATIPQSTEEVEVEPLFDGGDSHNAFDHFKVLLRCTELDDIGAYALKMVQLIQFGKVEKGAASTASKFNSRNGRWFSQKKRSVVVGANAEGSRDVDDDICIQPNSLVQVKCNRGKSVSVEYYRVLSLFDKYYNKWWVPIDCKFPWTNDPLAVKNACVLLRLMKILHSSCSIY